jgi:CubicO group peptidase (beta-lactamase class C family)
MHTTFVPHAPLHKKNLCNFRKTPSSIFAILYGLIESRNLRVLMVLLASFHRYFAKGMPRFVSLRLLFWLLIVVSTLTTASMLTSCASATTVQSYIGFPIQRENLTQHITQELERHKIPGASFALINEGKVVYYKTFGYANREDRIGVGDSTIFECASLSKSVFAMFVMTFVERGDLKLDTPLYTYLPHPDLSNDERSKLITARMILSHRSGLPNWRELMKDSVLNIKFTPGTDYRYSGEGFQYLAMVLKHISKTDDVGLELLFEERIAKPLGLKRTVFIQTPTTRSNKATPYKSNGNPVDWRRNYWFLKEDGKFFAPSSLHSEVQEFARWMQAIMNREILTKASYDELFTPHSVMPNDGLKVSYTLGFVRPHLIFTNLYLHSGENIGFTSWYTLDPDKHWGFVVFTNSDNGTEFAQQLFLPYLLLGL